MIRRFLPILMIALAGLGPAVLGQSAAAGSDLAAAIDTVFAQYDSTHSPGCSVGVIRDGSFLFKRGYGMADLERGVALSPSSVFRIGSTSKQFTAAAIALLEQEGKLSLDDDIRRHLPEMPAYEKPVTVRHLLHHTSGLRDYLTLFRLAGYRADDWYDEAQVLAMVARQKQLNFAPGDEYLYSNSGYFLLAEIVARAAGESLRAYADRRIFGPLGMTNSHFHDDHTEVVPNRAQGYSPRPGGGYRLNMTTLDMIGDGGVFTSVEDLLYWDRNFYNPRVGGERLLSALHRRGQLSDGADIDYALGLSHGVYRGLPTVSHGGSFVGFRADMVRFPEQKTTVVCLCNVSTANPSALARRVADAVLADRLEPAVDSGRRADRSRSAASEPTVPDPDQRRLYAGEYFSAELEQTYRLVDRNGELFLEVGFDRAPVRVSGPDRLTVRNMVLRFYREEGRPAGFELDAGRVKNLRFRRGR